MKLQTFTPVRSPKPCGGSADILAGRQPCQLGWYYWIGQRAASEPKPVYTILDVGAGCCAGSWMMGKVSPKSLVVSQDTDPAMKLFNPKLETNPISKFQPCNFDYVVCLDVLEHIEDDLAFFYELLKLTGQKLFITTPNWERSHAGNPHHAREYGLAQFRDLFEPDELWGGSPDGWHNITRLNSEEDFIFKGDGMVWAHMCAVFYRR